jgi:hypothetical protein
MGMCDPKAIRNGRSWADLVNQPGFMSGNLPGKVAGTAPNPKSERDNTLSKHKPKE